MIHDRMHLLRDGVQEGTVTGWNDWPMSFVWLMAVAIASAIYFFPIARLVDSLGD